MRFSEAKNDFDIRYYRWAISEFEREIDQSFPIMRLFKAGPAWKTRQFMLQLNKADQLTLARGLLPRFHANAVELLGETVSEDALMLQSRRDAFPTNTLAFDAEVRARRRSGEKIRFASKSTLRKVINEKFEAAFGSQCLNIAQNEGFELSFSMKHCGWIINTFFDFGRTEALVRYSHNIVSERLFDCNGGKIPMIMQAVMSFNSYLGIASQTEWRYVTPEEVENYCNVTINLCAHFFGSITKLLHGLDAEKMMLDKV